MASKYIVTFDKLIAMANDVYGCFLADVFFPRYWNLESDAEVYVARQDLEKLKGCETQDANTGMPFCGYSEYLKNHIGVMEEASEQLLHEIFGNAKANTYESHIVAMALELKKRCNNDGDVIIITDNPVLLLLAVENGVVVA